ncbi:unnamed protein product, partial [Scytosiphon promiscuus]
PEQVAEQLRCAGVVEAIRISRAAYPNRMARTDFNKRWGACRSWCRLFQTGSAVIFRLCFTI